ncbi:TPA: decarboxylase, partial [Enterococcus faecium]|nr:decarboxylase [Enterococcus faecium]HAQ7518787.1 decarboxylase [Enterococcus faecium]
MISSVKNVQILVSLLKQHNIKDIVISPGSRDFQLVHSVETDSFFRTYTVVDERSAAFFANGLSMAIDKPVCVCCTSSTASSNYMAAAKDAFANGIQLVLLTADRDYRRLYQMEDQMIDQVDMYGAYVRSNVDIPIVKDSDDEWYATRKINEAILELNHGVKGPVQINYQLMDLSAPFVETMPEYRKITRYQEDDLLSSVEIFKQKLLSKKRIMVLCGQQEENNLSALLEEFFIKYNTIIIKDNYSNIHGEHFIKTVLVTERMSVNAFIDYCPDLVITIGKHVWSFVKYTLRDKKLKFEHWRISEDGKIVDPFNKLTSVFQCSAEFFMETVTAGVNSNNNLEYYNLWKTRLSKVCYPELVYSNFYAISELVKKIPDSALVHSSILNAARLYDFVSDDKALLSFANLGADGIDGCLPTFLGQAEADKTRPAYLISGDLSFFYAMNSLCGDIPDNAHIFLINNHSGSEFHTNFGKFYNGSLSVDKHIAAGHISNAKDWALENNIKYITADSKESLKSGLDVFINTFDSPVLFEVFTDPDTDTSVLESFY